MKNINCFVSFILDFLTGYERELLTQQLLRMNSFELVKVPGDVVETYFVDIYCKNWKFSWGFTTTLMGIAVSVYTENTLLHERIIKF